jgi:CRP-like cAMP-binding protein
VALLPHTLADTALSRLFSDGTMVDHVSWFSLPGGQVLCETGETADELYFVRTGRLAAIRHEEGQEPQFLGVIRPGEPAGEMALIAGTPHSASVVALRDSEILALPRDAFFDAAEHNPDLMIELAKLMLQRSRPMVGRSTVGEPSVFGFVGTTSCSTRRTTNRPLGSSWSAGRSTACFASVAATPRRRRASTCSPRARCRICLSTWCSSIRPGLRVRRAPRPGSTRSCRRASSICATAVAPT